MTAASTQEPLRIAKQGSIEAGGDIVHCATTDGGSINPTRQIPGKVRINHVYATYQYPANQTFKYPVLFNPGGGHAARVYDTTPDGREGWLAYFVRDGFAVYGVDRVNSGRSGSSLMCNQRRTARCDTGADADVNRYPPEAAGSSRRWGLNTARGGEDTQFWKGRSRPTVAAQS
jgi:hypothetical protein